MFYIIPLFQKNQNIFFVRVMLFIPICSVAYLILKKGIFLDLTHCRWHKFQASLGSSIEPQMSLNSAVDSCGDTGHLYGTDQGVDSCGTTAA